MKKTDNTTTKGNLEVEIGGIKYCATIDLNPINQKNAPKHAVYGVRIDRKNSHPEKAVEYIGEAKGFTPANANSPGSWANSPIFNKIKPCLMINGEVAEYLNPNDYSQAEDGHQLSVVRNYSDTMIEFCKIFYRISQDENYTYIEITDSAESLKDGFTDWAFSYNDKVRDKFYIAAYKGYICGGKLRSISGKTPTTGETIGTFRKAAQANGEGYEITPFNKLILLQVLYVIRFKSLNSQTALGKGLVDAYEIGATGTTDTKGFYYGDQDGTHSVKCHGIEDFWGNIYEWVDGLITADNSIKIKDGEFNDIGNGYETVAPLPNSIYGLITDIYGENKLGFLPKAADDDISPGENHYCNYGDAFAAAAVRVAVFGGDWYSGSYAGAFCCYCIYAVSSSYSSIGSRLAFCGGSK
jgi:hypothetical protein